MKFHQLIDKLLVLLLCSGVYLPRVRRIVKSEVLINVCLLLSVVPAIGTPLFAASVTLCLFSPTTPLMQKLLIFVSSLTCFSTTFKFYFCHFNRKEFERIFDQWDESFEEDLHPDIKKEVLLKRKRTTDRWIVAFGSLLMASALLYGVEPVFSRKIEHPTAIPYSTDSPEFEVFAIYELIVQGYICLFVHSYNCLVMQTVAYEDAMCQYLSRSLAIIVDTVKIGTRGQISFSEEDLPSNWKEKSILPTTTLTYRELCEVTEGKIRVWIRQHQRLLRFHRDLQAIFHLPLSIEFSGLILVICVIVFMIVNNSLSPIMIFICVMYCFNVYTIFYVTCYYGDLTQYLSESLHEDAFGEGWYVYPRKLRMAFQIIIMRCGRPMNLKAFIIYPLNSNSFAKIFRHAYSFFMFLVQVIHRSRE